MDYLLIGKHVWRETPVLIKSFSLRGKNEQGSCKEVPWANVPPKQAWGYFWEKKAGSISPFVWSIFPPGQNLFMILHMFHRLLDIFCLCSGDVSINIWYLSFFLDTRVGKGFSKEICWQQLGLTGWLASFSFWRKEWAKVCACLSSYLASLLAKLSRSDN